jgi:O-antigen ligase
MQHPLTNARRNLLVAGRWAVLLCLFFIPINKPLPNLFIFVALLCSAAGERPDERFLAAIKQPIVAGSIIWFLVYALSALYAPGPYPWASVNTGITLFYPFIVATLLETPQWRSRGMMAFAASACLVLLISWSQFAGIFPEREVALQLPSYRYTVFKDYTQQGVVFLALAAMAAAYAMVTPVRKYRIALWLLAVVAVVNVVFLLQSRTSYLIVVPLLIYWAWRIAEGNWRKIAIGAAVLACCGGAALLTPRVQERLQQADQDVTVYSQHHEASSMGIRLELWRRTLPIIASAPVFGHGLGQWDHEYDAQTRELPDFDQFRMHHPHDDSLLILSEQGIVGYAIFLTLLVLLARYIRGLQLPERDFYNSLLLIFVMAGLAQCLLPDFTQRHTFLMLLACIPVVARKTVAVGSKAGVPQKDAKLEPAAGKTY